MLSLRLYVSQYTSYYDAAAAVFQCSMSGTVDGRPLLYCSPITVDSPLLCWNGLLSDDVHRSFSFTSRRSPSRPDHRPNKPRPSHETTMTSWTFDNRQHKAAATTGASRWKQFPWAIVCRIRRNSGRSMSRALCPTIFSSSQWDK